MPGLLHKTEEEPKLGNKLKDTYHDSVIPIDEWILYIHYTVGSEISYQLNITIVS